MVWQVVDQCSKEFIVSAFKPEKYKTDTATFRLHYKLSTWLVIFYSMCYMYVQTESPINCLASGNTYLSREENRKVVNEFCWVHGTYGIHGTGTSVPTWDIYPGVRGLTSSKDRVFYHLYYKWMYFYIVAMLILLQVPRQTWRFIEAGRMKVLASKLSWTTVVPDAEIEKEEDNLAEYLFSHLGYHCKYAYGFIFCELLNVGVAAGLLCLWDAISDHQLSVYGLTSFAFFQTAPVKRTDGLAKVFPLLGKCTFNLFGVGGNVVAHDVICVLPLNVINERAAVFFWFYFILLFTVGAMELTFRMMLIVSRPLRSSILRGTSPLTPFEDINVIDGQCSYSDWFVLNQLSTCLEAITFRRVLKKYVAKLRLNKDGVIV